MKTIDHLTASLGVLSENIFRLAGLGTLFLGLRGQHCTGKGTGGIWSLGWFAFATCAR